MAMTASNPLHPRNQSDHRDTRQQYAIRQKHGSYWVTYFGTGEKISGYMGSRSMAEDWIDRRKARSRAGTIDCMCCDKPFQSPDMIAIRLCNSCKRVA